MNKSNKEKMIKLVEASKKGDSRAFSQMYKNYIAPIYRFIFFRVKNKEEAEDLTQSVFLKAWNNLNTYKQKEYSFSSWLYAIARNTVIDYWKKKKELNIELTIIDTETKPIHESIENEQDIERLKTAINALSTQQQEVVILKFIEDFSNAEIAQIIQKREDAVRQLQTRAIKTLKNYFNKKI